MENMHILLAAKSINFDHYSPFIEILANFRRMGAKISVIQVVNEIPNYFYQFSSVSNIQHELLAEAEARVAKIGKLLDIPKEDQYIKIGCFRSELDKMLEELNIDYVCIVNAPHKYHADLLKHHANYALHHIPHAAATESHTPHILLAAKSLNFAHYASLADSLESFRALGAKISLLEVVNEIPPYFYQLPSANGLQEEFVDEAKERLAKIGELLEVPKANQYVKVGCFRSELEQMIQAYNVDFVCIVNSPHKHHMDLLKHQADYAFHHIVHAQTPAAERQLEEMSV